MSLWESAIKRALGRLRVPGDPPAQLDAFAFVRLSLTDVHEWTVRSLPTIHSHPFDRLLVAQARCERASVVSADAVLDRYGVGRIW